MGECIFGVLGWGERRGERIGFWVEWEMGCNMEYSLMECFL